jgi:predicted membrane protein
MRLNAQVFRAHGQTLLKLAALILLIIAAHLVSGWIVDALRFEIRPSNEDFVHRMMMIWTVAYALLIAIPFVPGVEIGLTLIGMLGPRIVFLVYVSTLAGLFASFVVGRLVSLTWLAKLFETLNFNRASQLLNTVEPMDRKERLTFLVSKAPNRLIPFLLRHRYGALAIAINLPGNIVIGGGGGISLMAGASKLYSVPGFIATIALAVSPIPIAILIFGTDFLSG